MKVIKMFTVLLGLLFVSQITLSQVKDISSVIKQAENGDAQSQYLLGWCYGTGNAGLSQDYSMAATWLEKSAAQGYEAAQYFLGWCYYYGRGVTQDYNQAVYWCEKAAKQGNTEAAAMVTSINRMRAYNKYDIVNPQQDGYSVQTFDAANPPILAIVPNSVKFVDPNGNNAIDADETCYIKFKVENRGTGDAFNCIAKVGTSEPVQGLNFKDRKISLLKANEMKEVEIPISATDATLDSKVNLYVQVNEPHGFGTEPLAMEIDTRKFEAPYLQIVDYVASSSNEGSVLKKKENFTLQVLLQNTRPGTAKDVSVSIVLPKDVMLREQDKRTIHFNSMAGNVVESIEYPLIVAQTYSSNEIPIELQVKEKYGKYAENRTVKLNLEQSLQQKIVVESTQPKEQSYDIQIASLGSDVDKNIPVSKEENKNTFALIIANESYKNVESVPFAVNDGKIFSEYCKKTLGIPEKQIYLASNATLNDIKYSIDKIGQVMDAYKGEAKIIVYYAGHGIPNEADKSAYLLPVDGYSSNIETGYSLKDLYAVLNEHPAKSVTIFLDACFSGSKREGDMLASARGVAIKVNETVPEGNMVVFTASQGDETAYPYKGQGHGLFTYFLLKKLQETDGKVSLKELGDYVIDQVRKTSITENGKMQTPTVIPASSLQNEWETWTLK